MVFVSSSGLLLPDSAVLLATNLSLCQIVIFFQALWKWTQDKVLASNSGHVECQHFSVLIFFHLLFQDM